MHAIALRKVCIIFRPSFCCVGKRARYRAAAAAMESLKLAVNMGMALMPVFGEFLTEVEVRGQKMKGFATLPDAIGDLFRSAICSGCTSSATRRRTG